MIAGEVDELKETLKLSSIKVMELTAKLQSFENTSLGKDKHAKYKSVNENQEGGFVSYQR